MTGLRAALLAVLAALTGVLLSVVLFGPTAPAGDEPAPVPTSEPGPPVPIPPRLTVLPFAGTDHPSWCARPAGGCTDDHRMRGERARSDEDLNVAGGWISEVNGHRLLADGSQWVSLLISTERGSVAISMHPQEAAWLRLNLELVEARLAEEQAS